MSSEDINFRSKVSFPPLRSQAELGTTRVYHVSIGTKVRATLRDTLNKLMDAIHKRFRS